MDKPSGTDQRVSVALGLLALVLALIGSKHISPGTTGPESGRQAATVLAAAVPAR